MALYLQLVKYTPAAAGGVLEGGFEASVARGRQILESVAGSVKGYWFVGEGDWHAAMLLEFPDDAAMAVRAQFMQTAAGAVAEVRVMRLAEAADVDAAQAIDYRPPGS